MAPYKDRAHAGKTLAQALERYRKDRPVILALPRGGVPVGYEVALSLDAPLDVLVVRKIGAPFSPELALGAVVDGDAPSLVLNRDIINAYGVDETFLQKETARQMDEIERRRTLYRQGGTPLDVTGKTVIVVDDGIATGATMRAALQALKQYKPAKLVLAVPVAAADSLRALQGAADDIVCPQQPSAFSGVGQFYDDFTQTEDADVIRLLKSAAAHAA